MKRAKLELDASMRRNDCRRRCTGNRGDRTEDGIVVDKHCRTKDSHIYAADDVARFPCSLLDDTIRVEHEDNANSMGTAAGRAMTGDSTGYDHLPFFYSDLFDLGYEAIGRSS